uniref:ATP synthase complex subunit 8 n=1 Tax=Gobiopterus lacustris TaxID=943675 RepID=A0A3G4RY96_GOBLA|nr:ATP synthase F0 subunit 8 [Gobiopterus lacustris]AYU71245.1 ATP synthase F0 subunit 8 [Gobiopterus lacustris]
MPQLNPAPWLMIFLFSWLILLTVVIPKTLSHSFPAEPTPLSSKAQETTPWTWPW